MLGTPPRSYLVPATSYFTFPNGGTRERQAIRSRVLKTINSTWGGPRTSIGTPRPGNGTIRIATWSFDDWDIAEALVAARKRGVSVQVVAAKQANKDHAAWHWLRKRLGQQLARPGYPDTNETVSFARSCAGACRGPGGTAHAKYFLFHDVGRTHESRVTFQTSSNLTYMAWQGQWNQAQVYHSPRVYDDFMNVFRQARQTRPTLRGYHVAELGQVTNYFFPRPRATAAQDPVMQVLNNTRCQGATTPGLKGRTKIRVDQYAIYGDRGVWIAKKLPRAVEGGLRRGDHLLGQQPTGARDPAQPDGSRPDPDAAVGGHRLVGHLREVQPQQVDDDHRLLGSLARLVPDLQRLGQLGGPRLRRRRADAAHLQRARGAAPQRRVHQDLARGLLDRADVRPRLVRPWHGTEPDPCRASPAAIPEDEPPFGTGIYRYMTPD